MKKIAHILVLIHALIFTGMAAADITIGVSLPLTGPASALGIPMKNQFALWPQSIAGEKIKLIILDDATDPTNGLKNARRFVTDDKVDLILGSAATPVGVPMIDVAAQSATPHLLSAPTPSAPGKDGWSFRLPQSNAVMSYAVIAHMKKQRIQSVGFLGYADAYGESWLKEFSALAAPAGIKVIATERFARTDTSVTAQALKVTSANPDAILIVASGSGAAMPHKAVIERGFKGKIYQTHAAASQDLMRVGGKDVDGAYIASGPVIAPEQLPDSHPSKKLALDYVQKYEKAYGQGSRNQFAAHAYDMLIVLEKTVPVALKKAKPGSREFRAALRDAIENMGTTQLAHGIMHWTKDDHWGYTNESGLIVKVVNGNWKLE